MRLFATLFTLLISTLLLAQTPSINYYGELPSGQSVTDFISLGAGVYKVYGNGYFEERPYSDIAAFTVYENGGPDTLIYFAEDKNQSVVFVEPMPDGRYVVCTFTTLPGQIFADIKLSIYDASGTELNTTLVGGPFADFISDYAVAEDGSIYFMLRSNNNAYSAANSPTEIIKLDNSLEEVYREELPGVIFDQNAVIPMPNGQLALFYADNVGDIQGRLLAEDGTTIWSQAYATGEVGWFPWVRGLFDGTNVELILSSLNSIWTIDVADGNLLNETDMLEGLSFIPSFDWTFYFTDSYWMTGFGTIYKFRKEENSFILEQEYDLPEGGSVRKVHFEGDTAFTCLTSIDELVRFEVESGAFTTLETFDIGFNEVLLERVERIQLTDDGLLLGISSNAGYSQKFVLVETTEAGELIDKVTVTPEGLTNGYEIISLANEKVSLLRIFQGEADISFWNTDGSLRSSTPITTPDGSFAINVDGVTLADGRLIGIVFLENPQHIQFYEIDQVNETYVELGAFVPGFSVVPGFIHALEDDQIGFIEAFASPEYKLLKVDPNGQESWENTFSLGEDNGRNLVTYTEWVVNPAADTYLIGNVIRNDDEPPYYQMIVTDTDGNFIRDFRSENNFLDATPIFINDDEAVVVGVDYNLDNQTDGEQFLLYYQRYDRMGNLLYENISEIPFQLYLHQLEILPNGNLALMGRVTTFGGIDAVFAIMDEQGVITKFTTLQPQWGQLQLGPNPGRDYLQLKLDNEYQGTLQISLIDSKGQQLRNWSADKLTGSWTWQQTLSDIPVGTYWVNISSPEGQVTKAWLKQ